MSQIPETNNFYWTRVILPQTTSDTGGLSANGNGELFQGLMRGNGAVSTSTLSDIYNALDGTDTQYAAHLEEYGAIDSFKGDISYDDIAKLQVGYDILTAYFQENQSANLALKEGSQMTYSDFTNDCDSAVLDFVGSDAFEGLVADYIQKNPDTEFSKLAARDITNVYAKYGEYLVSSIGGAAQTSDNAAVQSTVVANTTLENLSASEVISDATFGNLSVGQVPVGATILGSVGTGYSLYSDNTGTFIISEGGEKAKLTSSDVNKQTDYDHRAADGGKYGVYYEKVEIDGKVWLGKALGVYTVGAGGKYSYYEFTSDSNPKIPENANFAQSTDGKITFQGEPVTSYTIADVIKDGFTLSGGQSGCEIKDGSTVLGKKILRDGVEVGIYITDTTDGHRYYYIYDDWQNITDSALKGNTTTDTIADNINLNTGIDTSNWAVSGQTNSEGTVISNSEIAQNLKNGDAAYWQREVAAMAQMDAENIVSIITQFNGEVGGGSAAMFFNYLSAYIPDGDGMKEIVVKLLDASTDNTSSVQDKAYDIIKTGYDSVRGYKNPNYNYLETLFTLTKEDKYKDTIYKAMGYDSQKGTFYGKSMAATLDEFVENKLITQEQASNLKALYEDTKPEEAANDDDKKTNEGDIVMSADAKQFAQKLYEGNYTLDNAIKEIDNSNLSLADQANALTQFVNLNKSALAGSKSLSQDDIKGVIIKYQSLLEGSSDDINTFIGVVGAYYYVNGGERFAGTFGKKDFIENLVNTISASGMSREQLAVLNKYVDIVNIIEKNYDGSKETQLLQNLFNVAYSSASADEEYFDSHDITVSKDKDAGKKSRWTVRMAASGRYSSVQEARAAMLSTTGFNLDGLINNIRGEHFAFFDHELEQSEMELLFEVLLADDNASLSTITSKYYDKLYTNKTS